MTAALTPDQVWEEIENNLFAVIGMVTNAHESRTAGVVYAVQDRKLYITTETAAWKTKHIAANPHVSLTIPITKGIPFVPWVKIPAATITFCGQAQIRPTAEMSPDILKALFRGLEADEELMASSCIIEVTPEKEFITYGVGVSLMTMRDPEAARGRVGVA